MAHPVGSLPSTPPGRSGATETVPSAVHPDCFAQMTDPRLDGFILPDLDQIATVERAQISSTVLRQIGPSEIRC